MAKSFEEYWETYGELHIICGGSIKQFAKEIWQSASGATKEQTTEIEQLRKYEDYSYYVGTAVHCGRVPKKFAAWETERQEIAMKGGE